jgi:anthranilate phosphoribosyltransferase
VLTGGANEAQVGAMLALMQMRGVTEDELLAGARVMRAYVTPVPLPGGLGGEVVDTCGTGGAPKVFNISTVSAVLAAAARDGGKRVYVAKHGGRSRSGRGSAEVLESLGVNVDASPAVQSRCLGEAGVCFSFAIHHHPAMRFAAGPRKSLGFPTVFNLLGPLTNPAGATRQVMGVYDRAFVEPIARVLHRLGAVDALVVHGSDGLDEITTTGPTFAARVRAEGVEPMELDAASCGVARASLDDLRVGTLEEAAALVRSIAGGEAGAAADIAKVNAAAALLVGGVCDDLGRGLEVVEEGVRCGRAAETLETLARVSREGA